MMAANILIVDDDFGIREAMDAALGRYYRVRTAASIEDVMAIPAPEARDIRVIFLDGFLGWDRMPGDRALPWLKVKFPYAFIIYIGASGDARVPELTHAGVAIVLPKPVRLDDLTNWASIGMTCGIGPDPDEEGI